VKYKIPVNKLIMICSMLLLPVLVAAEMPSTFDAPDSGYVSNTVVDIIEHNGGIWFATGEGLNFSYDSGQTWLSYDGSNGLVSSNISALFSIDRGVGNRLWVATNHDELIEGSLTSVSDGVSYSDDNGNSWTQIDFSSSGLDIPYIFGGDRTIFDIDGHYDDGIGQDEDWLFFTAFAGGLMASRDGGINWRRIYPSKHDSLQYNTEGEVPSFRNRDFACAVDTSHGDSLFLWAGTAAGIFQHVFAPPKDKAYIKPIHRIFPAVSDANFVYYGGGGGFMRGTRAGGPYISRFELQGLPGTFVNSLIEYGGRIFVGVVTPEFDSSSAGLAISDDYGVSFDAEPGFTEVIGADRRIFDFAAMGDRLYMAAEEAGLYVSADTGMSWDHIFVDSSNIDPANRRNVVFALSALGDTLRIGTDSGLVQLFMEPTGVIDSSRNFVFPESDSSSTRVIRIKTHEFEGTQVMWTVNRPVSLDGVPIVARSDDGGVTFDDYQWEVLSHDINFFGDTTFVVGEAGARFSTGVGNPTNIYHIYSYDSDGLAVDSLHDNILTAMEVVGDTVIIGCDNGIALSYDRGETWGIMRINRDSLKSDVVLQYTSSISGIEGDFVPALGVQYYPDEPAAIWASTRPVYSGTNAISVGFMAAMVDSTGTDTLGYQRLWAEMYDNFAWNFAFNGDTVFAATDDGLIYGYGSDFEWRTLELVDSEGLPLVLPGTAVYGVEVSDDYVWVGTDDRTVRVALDDFNDQEPYFVIDDETVADVVYAFPVPFSVGYDQIIEFHFNVEQDAYITLEIYDFAMNLVRRVIDNQFYSAGIYPTAGAGRRTWDGYNGKGDRVAVGMYYFKVEYSTGEVRWGKLAVIP